jgi:uncharacterized membrane protein YjjP (DUF1212 family)
MSRSVEVRDAADLCLLAGKVMLQSGGETYRVEDTMLRMAAALGYPNAHSYVTPTGIVFAIDGEQGATRIARISARTTDLKKVTEVNGISRLLAAGTLPPEEARAMLERAEAENMAYPHWAQVAAAALASGCFLIMFKGRWSDFLPAVIAGGSGYLCFVWLHRYVAVKFVAEFLAAVTLGVLSHLLVRIGVGSDLNKIIIGSVMPLVPGVLITNAVRDLMAGHLVSGIAKGAEAFLTAFAVGAGIAFVLFF